MFKLFESKERKIELLERRIYNLQEEIDCLQNDYHKALTKTTEAELALKNAKTEEENKKEQIAHRIRMKEESNELEYNKKLVKKDREVQEAIAKVKDEYRVKLENELRTRSDELKQMYSQVLKRLPEIKWSIDEQKGDRRNDKSK